MQADVGRPEPVLFMLKASEEMERYHGEHGKYADRWHRLNFHRAAATASPIPASTRPRRTGPLASQEVQVHLRHQVRRQGQLPHPGDQRGGIGRV
ncbi:MAG: hypothetical protein WKF75_07370 [Singulisphaera sp.]